MDTPQKARVSRLICGKSIKESREKLQMEDKRLIYWHLPGFYVFFYMNQIIIKLMKDYPEKFRENYRIGSVYGTFPGAIWNGGRAVFGLASKGDMEKIISTYNRMDVPVRFT